MRIPASYILRDDAGIITCIAVFDASTAHGSSGRRVR